MKTRRGVNCEVLGPGPLTKTFLEVKPDGERSYLVWEKTGRYRLDEQDHPMDLIRDPS